MKMKSQIICGDALNTLKGISSNSIDCVITSPPYYQLRDYQVKGQIGLEDTIDEYIDKLIQVFDEVQRIISRSGTLFVNISDTYSGYKNGITDRMLVGSISTEQSIRKRPVIQKKSLMQIPSRFAIAMIEHGWILRNEIIWHKPNAMPQSVKDRFSVDYEKIYFFTKSPRYYFNQIKEPMKTTDINPPRGSSVVLGNQNKGLRKQDQVDRADYQDFNDRYKMPVDGLRNKRSVWSISTRGSTEEHFAVFPEELVDMLVEAGCPLGGTVLDPFVGTGTTACIAKFSARKYIGIDINQKFVDIARQRIDNTPIQTMLDLQ